MINLQQLSSNTESLEITAIIDTALSVGAGGASGSISDKPIVRNAEGNLLIPASQLKGRLRHECEKLARGLGWDICDSPNPQTMCPQRAGVSGNFQREEYKIRDGITAEETYHCLVCQLFGNPALPSRLLFDDLICSEDPKNLPEGLRPGVTLNRHRRTAEEQKLFFIETSPANAKLRFDGKIHFLANCPDYAKAMVVAGLHHIQALGGSKSSGLGWLTWEIPELTINQEVWDFLNQGKAG